jgi:hypothetical protein
MEYGVWSMEYGVWSMEYGVWSMEYGVQTKAKRFHLKYALSLKDQH